ncbi:MAG: hypothetical protein REI64_17630 [Pedobacter sp.]|uniref:hypothetical protein n=1 Tax=Pedobacter sp. TaxID=1411316 RepID=UPI002806A6B9|nr:hypothetical protein [Pedobacter sp.]MDQ8006629.1 hypothetical protein [Pedobacter sp.]
MVITLYDSSNVVIYNVDLKPFLCVKYDGGFLMVLNIIIIFYLSHVLFSFAELS